jgi:hypothetical protein
LPNDAEIGLDFMLIHNPMATKKIPHQWLKCGRECWMADNHLVINNWYKERTPYAMETDEGLTLEDLLQKVKSRRRVKREDVPPAGRDEA